ncbi:SHOCT domain-containing protein [Maledivibacter halophilus]|uniref:Putative membrane protein n=1 Tax=Maledivibacter halophilus TaxID=36842 RepID=A0A1T5M507_9FIRM|nr:SHOCT domain-containing protein [Maledivibacter halophilus]SKC83312.1 putative membrane protein [Maledivibacter halophilus]
MMHHWMGFNRFGWMGGFMMILWPLLIGVVFYLILKSSRNHSSFNNRKNNALKILDEKYASGAITEDEYLHKKRILKDD